MTITFPSHAGKQVKLAVRDMDKNPDEEGKENMRGGGTNYFIFPGESGQDPEWLKDEKWRGTAVVSFDGPAGKVECEPFVLSRTRPSAELLRRERARFATRGIR